MVSRFHILKLLFLLFIYFDEFLVDMFFLKTCSFNGVKPRLFEQHYYEGLFCLGTPTARFSIVPCDRSACDCCHSPCPRQQDTPAISFGIPHIHRFVNKYEAILNCPAVCIYIYIPFNLIQF